MSTRTIEKIIAAVSRALLDEHKRLGTWERVGKKYKRPKGTLHKIATQVGYCPAWLRKKLDQFPAQHRDLFA